MAAWWLSKASSWQARARTTRASAKAAHPQGTSCHARHAEEGCWQPVKVTTCDGITRSQQDLHSLAGARGEWQVDTQAPLVATQ